MKRKLANWNRKGQLTGGSGDFFGLIPRVLSTSLHQLARFFTVQLQPTFLQSDNQRQLNNKEMTNYYPRVRITLKINDSSNNHSGSILRHIQFRSNCEVES